MLEVASENPLNKLINERERFRREAFLQALNASCQTFGTGDKKLASLSVDQAMAVADEAVRRFFPPSSEG